MSANAKITVESSKTVQISDEEARLILEGIHAGQEDPTFSHQEVMAHLRKIHGQLENGKANA